MTKQEEQQTTEESNSQLSSATGGRRQSLITFIDIIVAAGIFVVLWQIVFQLKFYPSYLLPSPAMALSRFLALVRNGELSIALTATLERLVVGLSVSLVAGISVGLLMANFKRFGRVMSSFSLGLQSFPSIAWVPFAILIVGLNNYGILFVVIISSVFSMMISTYNGVRNINPIYLKASKNMGVSRLSLLRSVPTPSIHAVDYHRSETNMVVCLACFDRCRDAHGIGGNWSCIVLRSPIHQHESSGSFHDSHLYDRCTSG